MLVKCIVKKSNHESNKEGNVLFNDALNTFYFIVIWCRTYGKGPPDSESGRKDFYFNNAVNTFYLRLYGIRHMVKDHSDSEKGNPLLPHRLLFPIISKGSFICTIPETG